MYDVSRESFLNEMELTKEKLKTEEKLSENDEGWWCLGCRAAITASLGVPIAAALEVFHNHTTLPERFIAVVATVTATSINEVQEALMSAEKTMEGMIRKICVLAGACSEQNH